MPNKCTIKLHAGADMVPERCVRIQSNLFLFLALALTLKHVTEPLFFMHHAVSDRLHLNEQRVLSSLFSMTDD
jgi:hypothetical protein